MNSTPVVISYENCQKFASLYKVPEEELVKAFRIEMPDSAPTRANPTWLTLWEKCFQLKNWIVPHAAKSKNLSMLLALNQSKLFYSRDVEHCLDIYKSIPPDSDLAMECLQKAVRLHYGIEPSIDLEQQDFSSLREEADITTMNGFPQKSSSWDVLRIFNSHNS